MIYNELFDWQKNIVELYLNRKEFGLFLDMGLGKTPIALSFAEKHDCSKIIIISINLKATESEHKKNSWLWWAKKMKYDYSFIDKKNIDVENDGNEILLINYEYLYERSAKGVDKKNKTTILRSEIKAFLERCRGRNVALIIDESHNLINPSSKQTQCVQLIKQSLKYKSNENYTYLLTGTPFRKGYVDLLTQLNLLGSKLNITQFKKAFCIMADLPFLESWQQPIMGYKNLPQLYELIHQYALTTKTEEVIDLPDQIFIDKPLAETIHFKLFTRKKIKQEEVIKYSINLYGEDITYGTNVFYKNLNYPDQEFVVEKNSALWMRARQISIGFQGNAENYKWFNRERLDNLKYQLETDENNYIIFYNYTAELFEIFKICEELGYNIDVFCGEIKSLTFFDEYSNQTEEEKILNTRNVIICNYASGSEGGNWQEYNHTILFSVPTFADWAQAIKRTHRIGSKEPVFYYSYYQENWLDLAMIDSLNKKIEYNENMFNKHFKED